MMFTLAYSFVGLQLLIHLHSANAHNGWPTPSTESTGSWEGWGGNILNNRFAKNTALSKSTVGSVVEHCHLGGFALGISATPTLHNGIAYFPSWDGLMIAYDYVQCQVKWQTNITAWLAGDYGVMADEFQSAYTQPVSRTSVQINGDTLFIGTQRFALLLALDLQRGTILAHQQVNPHPLAVLTMSPAFYNGKLFIGASSYEESASVDPNYPCCSFNGNFAAFSFDRSSRTFATLWNHTMLPGPNGPGGWSGGGVWGSQPSIDVQRDQVFIATGNIYDLPTTVQACINATGNDNEAACYPDTVWSESVISFDIASGDVNWRRRLTAVLAWTAACVVSLSASNCPPSPGPDADFGMSPTMVLGAGHNAHGRGEALTPDGQDVVVVGQKNGNVYAYDAANGSLYWVTVVAFDTSDYGALNYGLAVDNSRIYLSIIDATYDTWTLQPSGQNISNAAYGAVNLTDGTILWEVQVPHNDSNSASPTITNDVVVVGNTGPVHQPAANNVTLYGSVIFLDSSTGISRSEIPWTTRCGAALQWMIAISCLAPDMPVTLVVAEMGHSMYGGSGREERQEA